MTRQRRDIRCPLSKALCTGLVVVIASCWLIAGEPNPGQAPENEPQAQPQLPEGKGKEIVAKKCVKCHTLDKVTKEHRTDSEWRDLLKIMTVQGLELTPDENQTVFEYVTTNFGKAQTPSMAQAVSVESGAKRP